MNIKSNLSIMYTILMIFAIIMLPGCGKNGGFIATKITESGIVITNEIIPQDDKVTVKTSTTYETKEKAMKAVAYIEDPQNRPDELPADYTVKRSGRIVTLSYSIDASKENTQEIVERLKSSISPNEYIIKDT